MDYNTSNTSNSVLDLFRRLYRRNDLPATLVLARQTFLLPESDRRRHSCRHVHQNDRRHRHRRHVHRRHSLRHHRRIAAADSALVILHTR